MRMIKETKFDQICGKSSKRRKCTVCNQGGGPKCNDFELRESPKMKWCRTKPDVTTRGDDRKCARCGHSAADHGINSSEQILRILAIEPWELKRIVIRQWADNRDESVPVVVNKPKAQ